MSGALRMITYDSGVILGSSVEAATPLNRDARVRGGSRPRATLQGSLGLRGGNSAGRGLDSTMN